MAVAETVFVADSMTAVAQLANPPHGLSAGGITALSMLDIAAGFLGGMRAAAEWLTERPSQQSRSPDRGVLDQVTRLTRQGALGEQQGASVELTTAMRSRAEALASYHAILPVDADANVILESLLHLHHNRAVGIDRQHEAACRRLARHAALAWRAAHSQGRA